MHHKTKCINVIRAEGRFDAFDLLFSYCVKSSCVFALFVTNYHDIYTFKSM